MLLQAALNGTSTTTDHPAVPESVHALARDAVACVAAGARAVHLHPRDPSGRESLEPAVVDEVVRRVREACGVPVGVTTGAWIEPSASWRVSLVQGWRAPDYASVNVSEEGWLEVARALLDAGIGVEAGVWTVEDAHALAVSGLAGDLTRVLVEVLDSPRKQAVSVVDAIHAVLDAGGVVTPRLQHGEGDATWVLLQDAVRRGLDTRVGLEDTLLLPDGTPARDNAQLVAAARALGAGG
ncbi:3-keto-5-aminohexanoate cleavage protein [Oryzihumus sp.]|uniref:3-keto-5-aminohexanoate cleavage protein n=1 Tax=Oryzihumus sp. TaxID=1968903 RepID=UPI002EDB6125